ncbi:bifunctional 2-C-methyl-D-erythritol 4-phosphate cytidylyltransferase/2-C-methyl-D-erythritol 2,4-cyclodiphosphate synthase [Sphingomonas sp. IC-56]|uniref:bifunctional 2-C-methyl-D-erythritol 4-phosphate cytidylyltransferase/2-C-methyl-D-erythritol 2,4-cyclodiphosphate synthase n=1 Tax=Sphingomonas sp. IC-56 TaxID=2898529 RepID=UPI001E29C473|nr:bifunctional 2-C-methyl-D-erythritol 4-phosphate cytidylyltransferase/2-C-methyl-D-erythritol 2,4-cyclodiphosphate synthase [Sphingomonas sp. IC-56]MCD2324875.1 bifunctional 2-C-methyl-D-erythritol 4-phosphate cytidylyltransferase/2-C-methyl-D-erythritol 2,4-cyclodiphosphate synthase [Sphingomonas sp. IC-56]
MGHPHTVALIVAAGQGTRTRAALPKQFALLGGRAVLAHSYDALASHPQIDRVVVVIGAGQQDLLGSALGDVEFVVGGATRRESVLRGLKYLENDGVSRVLVHDAARPLLPHSVVDRLLVALESDVAALPVLGVVDTILSTRKTLAGEVVPRETLARVQTPQAFAFTTLLAAHKAWPADREATDDAQMVRAMGGEVRLVQGDPMLEKITVANDFAAAEQRLGGAMQVRSAQGFDVHRFETGQELWLGGILIPHDKGLSGHSDADVALHAITDALLGTIAAGDIGMHFPPSDPKWRGAASAQFLRHALSLLTEQGGVLDFVDVTVMCEAPKIGPHRDAIRASIAEILALPIACVSVKATTTERLGFTGRGEGMAAQAIATVRVPVSWR